MVVPSTTCTSSVLVTYYRESSQYTSNSSLLAGSSCEAETDGSWDCEGAWDESIGGVKEPETSWDWLSTGGEKLDTISTLD